MPQKSEIKSRSNRHFTQRRLQVTGCTAERYCLLRVVVQGPGSFRDGQLFSMTYSCGATGHQNCQIFRFWPIFPYTKPLKRTIVEGPKGAFRDRRFFRLLVGELGTPKLAEIFAHGKWLYPHIMLLHGASDLDHRCLKTRNSEDECSFPPNIFAPTPKITPRPHFGGHFHAKPIRQSHVNGATTLKLYG